MTLNDDGFQDILLGSYRPGYTMIKFADEFQPGEALEPLFITVTPEWNEQILLAQEDYDRRYIKHGGSAADVHPALLLAISANTRSPSYRLRPGTASVLAEDSVQFLGPARVEDRLAITWRITSVGERRGRLRQSIEARITASDGTPVLARTLDVVFPKSATGQ